MQSTEPSPFLRLLPELRNYICALIYPSAPKNGQAELPTITLAIIDGHRLLTNNSFRKHLALTQTCRQIRNETRLMPYIGRNFRVQTPGMVPEVRSPGGSYDLWQPSATMQPVARYLLQLGPEIVTRMASLCINERGSGEATYMFTIKDGREVVQIIYDSKRSADEGYTGLPGLAALRQKFGGCERVFEDAGMVQEWYLGPRLVIG